jgi:membrane-associated PAP2 superfamily phosphatase
MKFEKIMLFLGLGLAILLAFKSLKQFIALSFTLLSLKIVWVALLVIFIAFAVMRKLRSSDGEK